MKAENLIPKAYKMLVQLGEHTNGKCPFCGHKTKNCECNYNILLQDMRLFMNQDKNNTV